MGNIITGFYSCKLRRLKDMYLSERFVKARGEEGHTE